MATPHLISYILPIFLLLVATSAQYEPIDCVYTFYVKTVNIKRAGTDSKISVILGDDKSNSVEIPNLERWGLMDGGHNYFEPGNLDVFSVRSSCDVISSICRITLTSDGTGDSPEWYVEYVEVIFAGLPVPCSHNFFPVTRRLSRRDGLTVNVDYCNYEVTQPKQEKKKKPSDSFLRKVVLKSA